MSAKPTIQPAGLYHRRVGEFVVTAVNDGTYQASFDLIAGVDHRECERLEREAFRVVPPRMTMNAFLLRRDGRLALIDTGGGVSMGETLGMVVRNLAVMGIAPGGITSVLMTHMHPDQMNGLIDAAGAAVFPNAELVINAAELQFFDDPASIGRVPEEAKGFFAAMQVATAPYRDRIRTVTDGPALPGVTAMTLPGHTSGHTAWLWNRRVTPS